MSTIHIIFQKLQSIQSKVFLGKIFAKSLELKRKIEMDKNLLLNKIENSLKIHKYSYKFHHRMRFSHATPTFDLYNTQSIQLKYYMHQNSAHGKILRGYMLSDIISNINTVRKRATLPGAINLETDTAIKLRPIYIQLCINIFHIKSVQ